MKWWKKLKSLLRRNKKERNADAKSNLQSENRNSRQEQNNFIEKEIYFPCNAFFRKIIEAVLEQFERYYGIFLETEDLSGLVKEYDAHLVNMHKQVRVLDPKEPYEAKAMGITPHGELIVDTWEGRKLVSSGEVSVRGVYGYV